MRETCPHAALTGTEVEDWLSELGFPPDESPRPRASDTTGMVLPDTNEGEASVLSDVDLRLLQQAA